MNLKLSLRIFFALFIASIGNMAIPYQGLAIAAGTYNITATAGANGSISPSGITSVGAGDSQTYNFTPDDGFLVESVTVDGVAQTPVPSSYTFTDVTETHTISVKFALTQFSITATTTDTNGTITPAGDTLVNTNGSQTYTITPNTGYSISAITVDGVNLTTTPLPPTYTFSNVTANHTINASFALIIPKITATVVGHGSISPAGTTTLDYGASQNYTFTPASGYVLASVSVDGTAQSPVPSTYNFSDVIASHTITATFVPSAYNVTATAGSHGIITPSGVTSVNYQGSQIYTFTPDDGYEVASVTVDNNPVLLTNNSYTLTNVIATHTISVTFVPSQYTITATTADTNGTITPAGDTLVATNGSQSYTVTANSGYVVSDIVTDGVGHVTNPPQTTGEYTFAGVTANHTISASFTYGLPAPPTTVTATAGDGKASVSFSGAVANGNPITGYTVTATPGSGSPIVVKGTASPIMVTGLTDGTAYTVTITATNAIGTGLASVSKSVTPVALTAQLLANNTANSITVTSNEPVTFNWSSQGATNGSSTYSIDSPACGLTVGPNAWSINGTQGTTSSTVPACEEGHTFTLNYTVTNALGQTVTSTVVYTILPYYGISASVVGSGSISSVGVTEVNKGSASPTYTFTPASGYVLASVSVDGTAVTPIPVNYQFTNVTAAHTIVATFVPAAYNIVATAGSNGTITPSGVTSVNYQGSQTYTFTPDGGYSVASVTVDGAVQSPVPSSYKFTDVIKTHTISVTFVPSQYTITATTADTNGTITPAGDTLVATNGSQSYTVTANSGYVVSDIVTDGVGHVTNPPQTTGEYTFAGVTANHTISASFTYGLPAPPTTVTATAGDGKASVSFSGAVANGNPITGYTVTATPGSGSPIVVKGTASPIMVTGLTDGTAYSINVTATNAIGTGLASVSKSVTPVALTAQLLANNTANSITVTSNEPVTFNWSSQGATNGSSTYSIDSPACGLTVGPNAWSINGTQGTTSSTVPACEEGHTFTLNYTVTNALGQTVTSTVVYTILPYYGISASVVGSGSISSVGVTEVNKGSASPTYTFTPASGYVLASVSVDGTAVTPIPVNYQFTNVTAAHTIVATFVPAAYNITATAGSHGIITPSGVTSVNYQGSQTYTFTPDDGYEVTSVTVDGAVQTPIPSSYTFTDVIKTHTISVTFVLGQYTITATTADTNGTITPAGNTVVAANGSQTYNVAANSGYVITNIVTDGVGHVTNPPQTTGEYTFVNVEGNHTINATFAYGLPAPPTTVTATAGDGKASVSFSGAVANGNPITGYTVTATPGSGSPIVVKGTTSPIMVTGLTDGTAYSISVTATNAIGTGLASVSKSVTPVALTAQLLANNTANSITVTSNEPVTFNWSSQGATNGSSTYSIDSPACGLTVGPNAWSINGTQGTTSSTVPACEEGHTFTLNYTVTNALGQTVTSTVVYTILPYYGISASVVGSGSISSVGVTEVNKGSASPTYTFTPASGYVLASVSVDGTAVTPIPVNYQFTNVTAAHTIVATFVPAAYNIVATAGSNGTITPSGVTSVNYQGSQTYTFTPDGGYSVASVTVDGAVQSPVPSSYKFTDVIKTHTISVTFVPSQYTITATTADTNGTITPAGDTLVATNGSQSYTVTANSGYVVSDIVTDGVGHVTNPPQTTGEYTFAGVTANHTISASFTYGLPAPPTTVTATAGDGKASVSFSGAVANGNPITGYTVTATPGSGSPIVVKGTASPIMVTGLTDGTAYSISVTATNAIGTGLASVSKSVTPVALTAQLLANNTANSITVTSNEPVTFNWSSQGATNGSSTYSIDSPACGLTVGPNAWSINGTQGTTSSTVPACEEGHTFTLNYTVTNALGQTVTSTVVYTILPYYGISASVVGSGSISSVGVTEVNKGSASPTYTFTPASGYVLASVSVDGTAVTPIPVNYQFTNVTAAHTIVATFVPAAYNIVATAGSNGTITPSGVTSVNYQGSQTYTFTPDGGYSVASVTVDGAVQSPVPSSYKFTDVIKTHTISVTFVLAQFTITATTTDTNGTITPAGDTLVATNGSQSYTVTANSGYVVSDITVDGVGHVTNPPQTTGEYTFAGVTANHTINASFAPIIPTITATIVGHGSISPAGTTTTLVYGASQSYTFTPASGYVLASVSVDGTAQSPVPSTYNFSDVIASHTIKVTFVPSAYNVTATSGSHGTITPSGVTSVNYQGSQIYTFTPDSGYEVASVTVNNNPVTATNNRYTLTNVTATDTINVTFQLTGYSITATTTDTNGSISPEGTTVVSANGSQNYMITPNTGYMISAITVDGVGLTGTLSSSYLFSNVTANHTINAAFAVSPLYVAEQAANQYIADLKAGNSTTKDLATLTTDTNAITNANDKITFRAYLANGLYNYAVGLINNYPRTSTLTNVVQALALVNPYNDVQVGCPSANLNCADPDTLGVYDDALSLFIKAIQANLPATAGSIPNTNPAILGWGTKVVLDGTYLYISDSYEPNNNGSGQVHVYSISNLQPIGHFTPGNGSQIFNGNFVVKDGLLVASVFDSSNSNHNTMFLYTYRSFPDFNPDGSIPSTIVDSFDLGASEYLNMNFVSTDKVLLALAGVPIQHDFPAVNTPLHVRTIAVALPGYKEYGLISHGVPVYTADPSDTALVGSGDWNLSKWVLSVSGTVSGNQQNSGRITDLSADEGLIVIGCPGNTHPNNAVRSIRVHYATTTATATTTNGITITNYQQTWQEATMPGVDGYAQAGWGTNVAVNEIFPQAVSGSTPAVLGQAVIAITSPLDKSAGTNGRVAFFLTTDKTVSSSWQSWIGVQVPLAMMPSYEQVGSAITVNNQTLMVNVQPTSSAYSQLSSIAGDLNPSSLNVPAMVMSFNISSSVTGYAANPNAAVPVPVWENTSYDIDPAAPSNASQSPTSFGTTLGAITNSTTQAVTQAVGSPGNNPTTTNGTTGGDTVYVNG